MMFTVDYNVKDSFFDRDKVQRQVDRGKLRALSKVGAFVRRRARTDVLRRRSGTSEPGQPPNVHSTDSTASLKNILFGLTDNDSVIIGPVKLNGQSRSGNAAIVSLFNIPEMLEHGGQGQILQAVDLERGNLLTYIPRRLRGKVRYRSRSVSIAARPFMSVALEREKAAGSILKAFENIVR
jgi:hypothetical protein